MDNLKGTLSKSLDEKELALLGRQLEHLTDPSALSEDLIALDEKVQRIAATLQTKKGDKGDSIKGDKGDSPSEIELLRLIKPLIPKVKDGKSPTEDELLTLIRPLIPIPKDGVTPTDKYLLSLIRPLIPKDGSPDTGEQIVEKINNSSLLIAKERVEGLVEYIRMAAQNAMSSMPVTTSFFNGLRAKNLTIVGATATQQGDTVSITIPTPSSGVTLTPETPIGTVDGVNVTFTVTHTPVQLFTDGLLRVLGTDYTYAVGTITMNALLAPVNSIISYYNA